MSKLELTIIINLVVRNFMKKIISKQNKQEKEFWFNWLTRKLDSYEAFKEFDTGQKPLEVAEKFIAVNRLGISEIFQEFDQEDKDTLDQFQKLVECEWHIFSILKKQLEFRNKVKFVDFRK